MAEVVQYASVVLSEEGINDETKAIELIADALNWFVEMSYIRYEGDYALCTNKYATK